MPGAEVALVTGVAPHRTTPDTLRVPSRHGVPFEILGRIAGAAASLRHHGPAAG